MNHGITHAINELTEADGNLSRLIAILQDDAAHEQSAREALETVQEAQNTVRRVTQELGTLT